MRGTIDQGDGNTVPDKTLIDPYVMVPTWKRKENFEITVDYFLDDTVDKDIARLWEAEHYENGEPTDDAVEHALFLDPPEHKYDRDIWRLIVDKETCENRMYFITDRQNYRGFVMELGEPNFRPNIYRLLGVADDNEQTDILEELEDDVLVKRIEHDHPWAVDDFLMKETSKRGEWDLYNEVEGWECLHDIEEFYDELVDAVGDQYRNFDDGREAMDIRYDDVNTLY